MGLLLLRRLLPGLVVLALIAPVLAAPEPPKFNVTFNAGWNGYYRPGHWTPLELLLISNLQEPFQGAMVVTGGQDSMTTGITSYPLVLTPGLRLPAPMVVKFANGSTLELLLRDAAGRERHHAEPPPNTLRAVEPNQTLIGVVGRRGFGLALLDPPPPVATDGRETGIRVGDKQPEMLPWDWTGYESLDLLILSNPNWSEIRPEQIRAITDWVHNGGKLLVILGANPLPPDNPLWKLMPVQVSPPVEAAAGREAASAHGVAKIAYRPLMIDGAVRTELGWQAYGELEAFKLEQPFLAVGSAGFGRVALLTMDPSALSSTGKKQLFWDAVITQLECGRGQVSPANSGGVSNEPILEHLLNIPELRPLSIWWVIGLLALLAVLLGPVDYLLLKWLDRQPWTWVTSAVIIVGFTVGAYYGVRAIRAGALQLRAVSVLDGIQGGPSAATRYAGLFAPESDEYRLQGLDKNRQWWCAFSPEERTGSWQMSELSSRRLYCAQQDGRNIPYAIPINIWSMQCLLGQSVGEDVPLTAKLTIGDQGTYELLITNRSDVPTLAGELRWHDRRAGLTYHVEVPSLPPNQLQTLTGHASAGSDSAPLDPDPMCRGQDCASRGAAIRRYFDNGAAVIVLEVLGAALPYAVQDKPSQIDHRQFVRLVVFPQFVTTRPR